MSIVCHHQPIWMFIEPLYLTQICICTGANHANIIRQLWPKFSKWEPFFILWGVVFWIYTCQPEICFALRFILHLDNISKQSLFLFTKWTQVHMALFSLFFFHFKDFFNCRLYTPDYRIFVVSWNTTFFEGNFVDFAVLTFCLLNVSVNCFTGKSWLLILNYSEYHDMTVGKYCLSKIKEHGLTWITGDLVRLNGTWKMLVFSKLIRIFKELQTFW